MKKLWEDIQLIYEGLNFSEKMIVDGLMIMPKDNYYSIYYKSNDSITYIEDRPFNDKRYHISNEKLKQLGWKICVNFEEGLSNCAYGRHSNLYSR